MTIHDLKPAVGKYYRSRKTGQVVRLTRYKKSRRMPACSCVWICLIPFSPCDNEDCIPMDEFFEEFIHCDARDLSREPSDN